MLAFPGMLLNAAKTAGMKAPSPKTVDADWEKDEYPHFRVFCILQLCKAMRSPDEHWHNAEVIAQISDKDIKTVTLKTLLEKGFSY